MQQTGSKHQLGIVVPHTHWDRAWYLPFQAYRLRLIEMLDELLGDLENGTFPVFVLDGQTVLLDDVFALRPEWRNRVEKLVRAGKIKIGPWYTMPDLFLAKPESLIRNLQRGLEMADGLGGGSRVGYVPDSFGHFAQLPQIFSGFGIASFLFMRGMPESVRDQHGAVFNWTAPNGSQVLATYLREGYFPLGALGQESFHGRFDGRVADLDAAQNRLKDTLARLTPVHRNTVYVLPAGGDHLPARADLPAVVAHLNAHQNEIELRFGSFEDYLSELNSQMLKYPEYSGDLLGQADHPLLRNVLSSRVDLKILNHKAQSLLCGVVEPLLAWSRMRSLPLVHESLVQAAWDALLKNHAHDDICGCSVDEVHLDNVQRYAEVLSLCREMTTRQLEHAVQNLWGPHLHSRCARVIVFNPHPWRTSTLVKTRILLPDEGGEFSAESLARELNCRTSGGSEICVQVLNTRCKDIRNAYLETTWGRSYELIFNAELPPLGFEIFTIEESERPLHVSEKKVSEEFQPGLVPDELLNAFHFELDVDLGDGYSFGPCPEVATQLSRLVETRKDSLQPDLYVLTYEIEGHTFVQRDALKNNVISDCLGPRASTTIIVEARRVFSVEWHKNTSNSVWELSIRYKNIFSNSRLRIVFAQPEQVKQIVSDTQALWQHHVPQAVKQDIWPGPLAAPCYPGEKPYPVHHTNDGVVCVAPTSSSFCGGVGLHEFEIVEAKNAIAVALTLHRAVGSLSVRGGRIRSCQAGPQRATPDAQMQHDLEHLVAFGTCSSPIPMFAFKALKEILHPAWIQELPFVPTQIVPGGTQIQSLCDVSGTPIQILACRPSPDGQGIIMRFLNPTETRIEARIFINESVDSCQEYLLNDVTPRAPVRERLENHTLLAQFNPFEIRTWKFFSC